MYKQRKDILINIGKTRKSTPILYVTGDRRGLETQISGDVIDILGDHLEKMDGSNKISLILYTLGGNTLAAWNIVNMIREYCFDFEIIVLNKARSAGTLMALGANRTIMTNISTLGPIDPSLTTPFNPISPSTNPPQQIPVSVEDVKGYFNFAKKELNIKHGNDFTEIYNKFTESIHPLVIGTISRSKDQIKMLANKLLDKHFPKRKSKIKKRIVSFLCSDSGSHDYTINKSEAIELGLPIETADEEMKSYLKELQKEIDLELMLKDMYDPVKILSSHNDPFHYLFNRCLIESVNGGSHVYVTEGILSVSVGSDGMHRIQDDRTADEWRKME